MNALVFLAVLILAYIISTALLNRFALKGLVCTRTFSKPAFFEGDEGEMIEIVRNDRPMIVPWLRVESRISAFLRLGRQANLSSSDHTHYCSLFTLMPYQQIRRKHRVTFLRRGEYNLGNAALTAGDLFGLTAVCREQQMDVPVLVYPRLLSSAELPSPLSMIMNETVSRRHLLTDPFLVRGIRTYHPGDPVRDIHWPATARMEQTQIRLHDDAAQSRLLVVLNVQSSESQWSDHLADDERENAEYIISVAATLCMQALENGCSAGFAANMPVGKDTTPAFLLPGSGAETREKLLSAFARLKTVRALSFTTFLDTLNTCTDLTMIVLSCYDSEEIQLRLRRLRRNGCQVHLVLLKGGRS